MINKLKNANNKNIKLDATQKFCFYVFVFLIGSIIGFIYEELFCLIVEKQLVYRGFLYGPYIPVYGTGSILLLPLLRKFKKHPLAIFFGTILITGVVEYFTGYLMWQLYQDRWWDYTGLLLNIDGYVCLRSVLTFAIGGLLLFYFIEPLLSSFIKKKDKSNITFVSILIIAMFVIDLVLTLLFRNTL